MHIDKDVYQAVKGYALKLSPHGQDYLHDAIIKAITNPPNNIKAFLLVAVKNRHLDELRKQKARRFVSVAALADVEEPEQHPTFTDAHYILSILTADEAEVIKAKMLGVQWKELAKEAGVNIVVARRIVNKIKEKCTTDSEL